MFELAIAIVPQHLFAGCLQVLLSLRSARTYVLFRLFPALLVELVDVGGDDVPDGFLGTFDGSQVLDGGEVVLGFYRLPTEGLNGDLRAGRRIGRLGGGMGSTPVPALGPGGPA